MSVGARESQRSQSVRRGRSLLTQCTNLGLAVALLWSCPAFARTAEPVAAGSLPPTPTRILSLEDRIEAQRAIERVYWDHRIWPDKNPGSKPPLSTVMPNEALRAKVVDYLRKSNSLEKWWHRPITAAQLQAELDRMASHTQDGRVLQDLFDALGNDPGLIAETLARQTLVDRMAHNWYASDTRFHGELKQEAESALAACANDACMKTMGGRYTERIWKLGATDAAAPTTPDTAVFLDPDEWKNHLEELAAKFQETPATLSTGVLSRLEETPDGFLVTSVLRKEQNEIALGSVVWEKQSFDAWWAVERDRVGSEIDAPASAYSLPVVPAAGCTNNTWTPTRSEVPTPRRNHLAVWTDTEMIIWGSGDTSGGRYNPSTDTWTATSTGANVPIPADLKTAVWTGTEMIIWGGISDVFLNSGGRYNPAIDSWTATSTGPNTPSPRYIHTAVWTGTEMIVWGGTSGGVVNTGGRYNPSTNTWTTTSTGTNVPAARNYHTAVWTGTEMIVWGGYNGSVNVNTGGRYNPSTNTWLPTSTGTNVPAVRRYHTAVWGESVMIVWGGWDNDYLNTGGRYDPSTDTWLPTSTGTDNPLSRYLHTVVWTGTEMIVWGGLHSGYPALNVGGRYNPVSDTWTPTSSKVNVPAGRFQHSAVWTGTEMIVWGGWWYMTMNSGGRYNPATDTWVPTSTGPNVPVDRYYHSSIWTGAEMIVWGGSSGFYLDSGGRYLPSTDTWTPTSRGTNLPAARDTHTAVWTGTEMLVWGGNNGNVLNSGGRYTPLTDGWTATSTGVNVATARSEHTAEWTGTEMLVWGGFDGAPLNSGGRYSPSTDSWATMSIGANVPTPRRHHASVWTGTEMIVWGGYTGAYLNSGGRYNPTSDTWTATSTGANVPAARRFTTALWTGTEMIVWGGIGDLLYNNGSSYSPSNNTWKPISTGTNVAAPRYYHTAVWTGSEMIVWGGSNGNFINSGGRYHPATDSWTATSTGQNDPQARYIHTAAWTGSQMIVWGGVGPTASGGLYCACPNVVAAYRDADGDAYGDPAIFISSCADAIPPGYVGDGTDCDDAHSAVHPGAAELCNGIDDNCSGTADEGGSALCGDGNVCTDDACTGLAGCAHTNNTLACNDANACTVGDVCSGGACAGSPLDCSDGDACTLDTCDTLSGCGHTATCSEAGGANTPPGGTATTDSEADGATPSDPIETGVTTPTGGPVTIQEGPAGGPPPTGYNLLDVQVMITAPVETPETPLVLVFRLDASALPPAFVLANLTIFRNGVIVPNCAGAPGEAAPDPCVASRTLLGDGDASVAVRTSAASTWTFAIPNCNDLPSEIAGLSVAGQANPTLSWNGQGAGRFYDVISSTLADLRAHGTATASCLANDIVQTTYGDTRPGPAPSDGYYYLIRAQDPCGAGSYGVNSSGLPHQPVAACP